MNITDDLNNRIYIASVPDKIISLCPSITETLCDIGLSDSIIGITDYCIHPIYITKNILKLGGPKTISVEKVKSLNPDIIFAVKEENTKSTIEALSKKYPCFVFDINTFNDAIGMIKILGKIFQKEDAAKVMSDLIITAFSNIPKLNHKLKYLYIVWKQPYIAVGKGTFIDSVLTKLSFSNCIKASGLKYPKLNSDLNSYSFDILFLASEPYKFDKKDKEEIQKKFPDKKILLVDGEMISWYGSHMLKASYYLRDLIRYLNI